MKPIFEYMNYREFLRDAYAEKKEAHSFYSYRLFSQKAGFSSPNFLKLVIDGKRNLSKESAFKFAKGLNLNIAESDYFENLVFFNQSKTLDSKNSYLARIMKYRRRTDPKKIEESEYAYYSAWYNPVVCELATAIDFKDNFAKLGEAVIPQISGVQAKKSVKLLTTLNFIKKTETGLYAKCTATLTTGPIVRSIAVANYHKAMLQRAAESIERFPATQRDISSLTLRVSEKRYKEVIDRIRIFRKELLDTADVDGKPDKVVQINFQAFPLSKSFDELEQGI